MSRSFRSGFTMLEVLVIIAILAILIAMLVPATRRVRVPARRTHCANNLKQLMLAFHNFHDASPSWRSAHGGNDAPAEHFFPPGCLGPKTNPDSRLSWMVALLPYLEQDNLYGEIDLDKGYLENCPTVQTPLRMFKCPASTTDDAVTSYVAMSGIGREAAIRATGAAGNGFMGYDRLTSISMIKDGISNTIALMETQVGLGPWARGGASTVRGFDPGISLDTDQPPFGRHGAGMNVALVDGSVRFVSSWIEPATLTAAITITGGETVDWD